MLVQRITGDPDTVRATLDDLVEANLRFLADSEPPAPEPQLYTVQSGDSLSRIALQVYGQASLWTIIFEANRDVLSDPSLIRPGQVLVIPPKPA
ncbi:MAG: LysM peptidoglycan-binding domain-containing protein [Anaerolineae bacterium]|nr:LysM peptidoglycan-binding domain-containing protein [Anaerolineae bacterium]